MACAVCDRTITLIKLSGLQADVILELYDTRGKLPYWRLTITVIYSAILSPCQ